MNNSVLIPVFFVSMGVIMATAIIRTLATICLTKKVRKITETITKEEKGESKELINLSAPWYIMYNRICNVFKGDPEVIVDDCEKGDNDIITVNILVKNTIKYLALTKIIKQEFDYGGTKLVINFECVVNDKEKEESEVMFKYDLFDHAFDNNPIYSRTNSVSTPYGVWTYVLFNPIVMQFWADDISDMFGNQNETVEDSIKMIVDESAINGIVSICTESIEELD